MKKERKKMPENETKHDKFVRLAMKRVPRAIKSLRVVASLFKRPAYEWTDEEAKKIVDVLSEWVSRIADQAHGSEEKKEEFSL